MCVFNLQKILFANSALLWNKNIAICISHICVCQYIYAGVSQKCMHFIFEITNTYNLEVVLKIIFS